MHGGLPSARLLGPDSRIAHAQWREQNECDGVARTMHRLSGPMHSGLPSARLLGPDSRIAHAQWREQNECDGVARFVFLKK